MASLLANAALLAALAAARPKPQPNPRDPNGCYSCGENAIIRDPRSPYTVRCGMCGAVRQILVERPSVAQRVATERERHGGGPRVVG